MEKKPSERIEELRMRILQGAFNPIDKIIDAASIKAIVQYLDEQIENRICVAGCSLQGKEHDYCYLAYTQKVNKEDEKTTKENN